MKLQNLALSIIGVIMIIFNLLRYTQPSNPPTDSAERAGYYVGQNIFFIIGIVLLIPGFRRWRKEKQETKKKETEMIDNLLNDSKSNNQ